MSSFEDEKYIDDGTVYEIKKSKEKIDEIINYPIDFEELTKKYTFHLNEKELIHQATLEQKKSSPNIELIKEVISIIEKCQSNFVKNEQEHLKHVRDSEPDKTLNVSPDINEEVWKIVLLALFFGPLGLLKLSWQLALGVGILLLAFLFTIPELLAAIPLISAALAWIKLSSRHDIYYHKENSIKEPRFQTEENEHPLSVYRAFLKQRKTLWLASVLGFVFGCFGLLYVSWIFALGMLVFSIAVYISFPILLISIPFISLGLALYAATETNAKLSYRHLSP